MRTIESNQHTITLNKRNTMLIKKKKNINNNYGWIKSNNKREINSNIKYNFNDNTNYKI